MSSNPGRVVVDWNKTHTRALFKCIAARLFEDKFRGIMLVRRFEKIIKWWRDEFPENPNITDVALAQRADKCCRWKTNSKYASENPRTHPLMSKFWDISENIIRADRAFTKDEIASIVRCAKEERMAKKIPQKGHREDVNAIIDLIVRRAWEEGREAGRKEKEAEEPVSSPRLFGVDLDALRCAREGYDSMSGRPRVWDPDDPDDITEKAVVPQLQKMLKESPEVWLDLCPIGRYMRDRSYNLSRFKKKIRAMAKGQFERKK